MRPFLFVILSLFAYASAAPKLILPDESHPLLRRDLLPLDVDDIHELAVHLATLGDGPAPIDSGELRDRVKILTLSQRLSPGETRVRAAFEALENGDSRPAPVNWQFNNAQKSALATAGWLIDLPTDSEGYLLGQLILDTLAPLVTENPMIARRDAAGEPRRWRGVIADVAAFESKPETAPRPSVAKPTADLESTDPTPVFKTLVLTTSVPMLCKDIPQNSPVKPALVETRLVIFERLEGPGSLVFIPDAGFDTDPLKTTLENLFQSLGHSLPKKFTFKVHTDERNYSERNGANIVAPIAMMLDAALSGRPLRPNTLFFAGLSSDGILGRPDEAWELLLDLIGTKPPPGTRLIVGPGLSEELEALLVIRRPGFFVDFEVISAPTFELARELFYEDGEPAPEVISAIAGFREVREKARDASSLPAFLAIKSVEARLSKIRESSPAHLSATLLAHQSIRRPFGLSRYMLAQEIHRRLRPLAEFNFDPKKTTTRDLRNLQRETRESLQQIEKLIGLRDQDLPKGALDLIKPLNGIASKADKSDKILVEMIALKESVDEFRTKLEQIFRIAPPE